MGTHNAAEGRESADASTTSRPGEPVERTHRLGRFGLLIGRLFGSSGRRTGARDTDPGR